MTDRPSEVSFGEPVLKQLRRLDKPVRARISRTVRELATDPRLPSGLRQIGQIRRLVRVERPETTQHHVRAMIR